MHDSGAATVTITITPVNDNTPVAVADAITVAEGGTATALDSAAASVLRSEERRVGNECRASVSQVNGSKANVEVATATAHGSVTVHANGTFSYTHDGSENFRDSFTY